MANATHLLLLLLYIIALQESISLNADQLLGSCTLLSHTMSLDTANINIDCLIRIRNGKVQQPARTRAFHINHRKLAFGKR